MRNFTATTLAALAANEFGVVDLLTFNFPTLGTIEITNAGRDIGPITMPYGVNRTFTGNGTMDAIIANSHELEFNKAEIKLTINGASAAFLSAVQSGEHIDTRVRMYKLFYTDEATLTTGEVEQMYDGIIVGGNFTITSSSSSVNLACSHTLYNFDMNRSYITSEDSLAIFKRRWQNLAGMYIPGTSTSLPSGSNIQIPAQLKQPRWGVSDIS